MHTSEPLHVAHLSLPADKQNIESGRAALCPPNNVIFPLLHARRVATSLPPRQCTCKGIELGTAERNRPLRSPYKISLELVLFPFKFKIRLLLPRSSLGILFSLEVSSLGTCMHIYILDVTYSESARCVCMYVWIQCVGTKA
jgi:hypothetical protein